MSDDFFAVPRFRPDEAEQALKRGLRDLRPLVERGQGFDLAGQRVVEWSVQVDTLDARLAKPPARTPEWDTRVLKNGAEVRGFLDEVRKRLSRWEED